MLFRRTGFRTPVEFKNVRVSEMKLIELQAKASGLKYEIKKESECVINEDIKIEDIDIKVDEKEAVVEELQESDAKTILEKLISENKD